MQNCPLCLQSTTSFYFNISWPIWLLRHIHENFYIIFYLQIIRKMAATPVQFDIIRYVLKSTNPSVSSKSSAKCKLGSDLFLQYCNDSNYQMPPLDWYSFTLWRQVEEIETCRGQILTRNATCSFAEPPDGINTVGNGAWQTSGLPLNKRCCLSVWVDPQLLCFSNRSKSIRHWLMSSHRQICGISSPDKLRW